MAGTTPTLAQKTARILIVEDHPIVRRGLVEIINHEPDMQVCGEAEDVADALEQVESTHPDLAIIDISLRSGNGIELIKQVKARDNHVRMLVSSVYDESLYAERALRAGATGYINKDEAVTNIVSAIRQVLMGRIYLSWRMTNRVLQAAGGQSLLESPMASLSDRELQVFELISQGLTTRQIAAKLMLSVKTIETHRDHIKMKLKLKNSTELTHRAVQWALENNLNNKEQLVHGAGAGPPAEQPVSESGPPSHERREEQSEM